MPAHGEIIGMFEYPPKRLSSHSDALLYKIIVIWSIREAEDSSFTIRDILKCASKYFTSKEYVHPQELEHTNDVMSDSY